MQYYIGLIHKEADSDCGVSFPDFPGVATAGKKSSLFGAFGDAPPGPPPFSSMNSMPANTKARRTARSLAAVIDVSPSDDSARRIWVRTPNNHSGPEDVGPSDFAQFWISSPDTRWNSRSLFVTRISLAALACAAIHRSLFPMTRPLASSSARRAP